MVVDCLALVAILLGEPECDALALALAGAEMPVMGSEAQWNGKPR